MSANGNKETAAAANGGLSRRDLLKYTAVAGAAAGAAMVLPAGALAAAPAASSSPVASSPSGASHRFLWDTRADIPGAPLASAALVSVEIEPFTIEVREMTTGADWDYRTYAPGDAHYGKVTFRCRVGKNSKELYQWWLDASRGLNVRKNISIVCTKRDGSESRTYNLMECFPIKFDPGDYSPSSNVAVESVTCKMGRVELA